MHTHEVKDMSKANFLQMLKKDNTRASEDRLTTSSLSSLEQPADQQASSSSWAALKDDYLMGSAKMKDWNDDEDEDEDEAL